MVRSLPSVTAVLLLVAGTQGQSPTIHHWPLNEAEGTTAWDHIGDAHGTKVGNATWDPTGGRFAGAARFDGATGRIQTGPCDLTNGGGGISISAWVKPDFVTGMERTLLAKATAPDGIVWSISIVNATALRFRLLTAGQMTEVASTPSLITSGTWYLIVATYDGAELRLYVNGSMIASTPATGTIGHHPGVPVAMGAMHNGQQPFSGWIDDARIHDRGLDQDEVLDLLFENVSVGVPPSGSSMDTWTHAEVIDVQGRVLRRMSAADAARITHAPSGLATGVHLLRLLGPHGVQTRRVFIP